MFSRFLSGVILLASLFVSGVWAQSEMAECPAGWEWNRNSLDQDPCTVGSRMDATCRGIALYTYPPINGSQYYVPPRANYSDDLTCDCNTVMYNLYMACSSCQGARTYSWPTWRESCETVYVSEYPSHIPQGTAVPYWAYFNTTSTVDQLYNDTNAMALGRDPEGLPPPLSTITLVSTHTPASTVTPV